jgi:hypothetical protein
VNLLEDVRVTIKKNPKPLIDAGKEVGREVKAEKTTQVYFAISSPECKSKS